ncbi:MAG: F0F1 ATP synthase subunit epsilon [Thalassolituus oleivorans]|uniref:F0F1 ATP synthase subunit epsilon n=1 Tax=Thalassolituus oleivorans TaxID=187493 RepID=UPI001B549C9F|nr:F0F1 ATP synthase subunit epsilon [Thalassolituus oleivorans]MBQ0728226.1 F0F1 ATP synthase subunit epsilon [Thalassolituus oleivorans]MBQ0779453.1 F0F1 ATP synthase subunit epsilon [Thalassolituus oleivorans]
MHLKVLLPFEIFTEKNDVIRIVAETIEGSFGILPQRLDCVAVLEPGILTFETESEGEIFIAVDEGVLIKAGTEVLVSVRRAIKGADLKQLHRAVEEEFLNLDEETKEMRIAMAKLESGFIHKFAEFRHD